MSKKRKKLKGTVQKIIKPQSRDDPEKAQISVDEGDDLYRELRVENVLTGEGGGEKAAFKTGAESVSSLRQIQAQP